MHDLDPTVATDVGGHLARSPGAASGSWPSSPSGRRRGPPRRRWPSTNPGRRGSLRILGVHSATDANHQWPEYGAMLGARFDGHPWTQDFPIDVVDSDHPATAHLAADPQWPWKDEIYLFTDLRPDAHVLLRLAAGPGRPARAREAGSPLAASPWPGASRRAQPAPSTARSATSPGRGRRPRTCATSPGASPGWRRAPNLTPMSGSSLPEVMAAAVYQSPGVITVEERKVPRPGPDQLVVHVHSCGICGSDIHQLRDGWGFTPGAVAGHEWSGTIAAIGEDVTDWSIGELVVGGPGQRCGTCRRCLEGKPSQCENRNSMTRRADRTAPSPSTSSAAPPASCAFPRASRPATPRWPSLSRWRCTASPAPVWRPATASWSSAPARSAR